MPDQAHAAKSTAPPVDDLAGSTASADGYPRRFGIDGGSWMHLSTGRETITQPLKTMFPAGQIA